MAPPLRAARPRHMALDTWLSAGLQSSPTLGTTSWPWLAARRATLPSVSKCTASWRRHAHRPEDEASRAQGREHLGQAPAWKLSVEQGTVTF